MKQYLIYTLLVLAFHVAQAQNADDLFTIYLVRHAEKDLSDATNKNPSLSSCGQQRAESLVNFFQLVSFDAIYSSDYTRTLDTAKPIAQAKNKEVTIYDPRKLDDFSKMLLSKEEDALVVGHSNTTGVLAGLLSNQKIGPFDESIYNRIYQVVIYKQTGRLQVFHTAFLCE